MAAPQRWASCRRYGVGYTGKEKVIAYDQDVLSALGGFPGPGIGGSGTDAAPPPHSKDLFGCTPTPPLLFDVTKTFCVLCFGFAWLRPSRGQL